jgi:hypothetical protein
MNQKGLKKLRRLQLQQQRVQSAAAAAAVCVLLLARAMRTVLVCTGGRREISWTVSLRAALFEEFVSLADE